MTVRFSTVFIVAAYVCAASAIVLRKSVDVNNKDYNAISEMTFIDEVSSSENGDLLSEILENNAALIESELDYASELAGLLLSTIEDELVIDNYISNQGTTFKALEAMKEAVEVFHEVEHTVLEDVQHRKASNSTVIAEDQVEKESVQVQNQNTNSGAKEIVKMSLPIMNQANSVQKEIESNNYMNVFMYIGAGLLVILLWQLSKRTGPKNGTRNAIQKREQQQLQAEESAVVLPMQNIVEDTQKPLIF